MKRILLAAGAAALTFTAVSATAQDRDDWRRDHDRYEHRGYGHEWRRGMYYPRYRSRDRMVDWRAYHLRSPYPGYAWYRDDDGSFVMAALASGIIGMALADQYGTPGYYAPPPPPPSYYYPY